MSFHNLYEMPHYKSIIKLDSVKELDKYIIPLGIYRGCIYADDVDIEESSDYTYVLIWVREKETVFIKYEASTHSLQNWHKVWYTMLFTHPGRIVTHHLKIYDLWKTFSCNPRCNCRKGFENKHFNDYYERISYEEFMRTINLLPYDKYIREYNFKPDNIWTVLEEEDM